LRFGKVNKLISKKELIAAQMSTDGVCRYIGADALHYLSQEGLEELAGTDFCYGCFTGEYPF
jgi:amidophosphoribosyltransferase